jgi:hypothetical protein
MSGGRDMRSAARSARASGGIGADVRARFCGDAIAALRARAPCSPRILE